MAYAISSALAIYFVIWWITLFLTLPFGVRSQHEDGEAPPGTDPGAPVKALMLRKLIWTTIIAIVMFFLNRNRMISRNGPTTYGDPYTRGNERPTYDDPGYTSSGSIGGTPEPEAPRERSVGAINVMATSHGFMRCTATIGRPAFSARFFTSA